MAVAAAAVGARTEPISHTVDSRWLMAYAAALGRCDARSLDTTLPGGVAAHPLFPVCVEWPTVLALRDLPAIAAALSDDEARRAVHATHDLRIERPVMAGEVVTTSAEIVGVEARSPGAYVTAELTTVDADGTLLWRTTQGSLYLGVAVDGLPRPAPATDAVPAPGGRPVVERAVAFGRGEAHIYTECARIWNPIHTDVGVARRAGLSDIILHGTATLAHAVSVAMDCLGDGEPTLVRRVRGRFGAMVALPSTVTVVVFGNGAFEVRTADGGLAVAHGHVQVETADAP